MATYPEGNPGAHPIDPSTDVGLFRVLYGDDESSPYDPPVDGVQNYEELSDEDIEALIEQGSGSIERGIGYYYVRLAGRAAKESRSVKDYDLTVDNTKRASDLRAMAQMWFDRADEDDQQNGASDIFEVFDMTPGCRRCELAESPCYCRGF